MKGAFWDPERDFRGRRILGGLLGEPYHAHTGGVAGVKTTTPGSCVFITAVPIAKLFAWAVWTSLPIAWAVWTSLPIAWPLWTSLPITH